jgi:L-iditol 2-dehydrogenase
MKVTADMVLSPGDGQNVTARLYYVRHPLSSTGRDGKESAVKAVRKLRRGPGNVELVEVPEPRIGTTDVLMKVWAAGVCGSDLNIQDDTHFYTPPVTLGHEYAGMVIDVGSDVRRVKVGDKIAADIETDEGWLGIDIDGSYAPIMRVPEKVVHLCPADMDLDAATLAEPVTASIHCYQERTSIRIGDTVLVVGPGPMGILAVQFAKMAGAKQVILSGRPTDAERLAVGERVGADVVVTTDDDPAQAVMDLTGGRGADYVAECSGTESGLQQALDAARAKSEGRGGLATVCLVAMYGRPVTLSFDRAPMGQLNLIGSWSWSGPETWERAIDLLHLGRIDYEAMITSRYELEEWEIAFDNLRACRDVKALIHPNGRDWG